MKMLSIVKFRKANYESGKRDLAEKILNYCINTKTIFYLKFYFHDLINYKIYQIELKVISRE